MDRRVSASRSLSRGIPSIKAQNPLNLMDTCSSFWEALRSLIVFVLINGRSKLNCCAVSHVTHLGEFTVAPIAVPPLCKRAQVYLPWL